MIKLLNDNQIDLNSLEIGDVIDLDLLQKFQDNFAISMGMGTGTIDRNGNLVTKPSFFTEFCMDLTHSTAEGNRRCDVCSQKGGRAATETGKPYIYKCHAGLIDLAVPIMIENHQIGSIIGGQIPTEEPDEARVRKTAREIGVDGDKYYEAIKKIRVAKKENIDAAAEVLFAVANSMSSQGYEELKLKIMLEALLNNVNQIFTDVEALNESSQNVTQNQQTLNHEINSVKELVYQIDKILKSIERIADEIKILGINAAIEAARAGTSERGFGVVAEEIRQLAQRSKDTARDIEGLTFNIQNSVDRTIDYSNSTLKLAMEQARFIGKVNGSLQKLTDVYLEKTKSAE